MENKNLDIKDNDLDPSRLDACLISITSDCNLRCVYCASIQPWYKRMDLDMGILDDLINEFRLFGLNTFVASGHGETTIVPDWHNFLRKIRSQEFGLSITSNFARIFNEEEIDLLARMDDVVISIDTVDRELLMKIRQSVCLETILYNMFKISIKAKQLGKKTHFAWQNTLSDLVVPHLKEYIEYGLESGVKRFHFHNLIEHEPIPGILHARHPSTLPIEQLINLIQAFYEIINIIKSNGGTFYIQPGLEERINTSLISAGLPAARLGQYYDHRSPINKESMSIQRAFMVSAKTPANKYDTANRIKELETRGCVDPWTNPYILPNGDVWPCCWSYDPIGNIYKEKFRDIWNGNNVRKLRHELLSGNLRKQCLECPCRSWANPHRFLEYVRSLPLSNIKLCARKKRK